MITLSLNESRNNQNKIEKTRPKKVNEVTLSSIHRHIIYQKH